MSTIKLDGFLITETGSAFCDYKNNENGNLSQRSAYSTKGFEMQLKLHRERVVNTSRKDEIDTERVRRRKQTRLFQCAKTQKVNKEVRPTVESIALERRKQSSRTDNTIVVNRQLPREVSAIDRSHKRCFYWG